MATRKSVQGWWPRLATAVGLTVALALPAAPPVGAASLSVTTTNDELNSDGDCSLREAIRAANLNVPVDACPAGGSGLDTINLPAGTYKLSVGGANEDAAATGDLDLTGTLKLQGAGVTATIIDAQDLDRVFDVLAGATVTLSRLTIQNGTAPDGGGARNAGALVLQNVTVQNNAAVQQCPTSGCKEPIGGRGGGLYNTGTLSLTNTSLVQANSAVGCCFSALSGANQGGGVYNAGTLLLNDTMLNDNQVYNDSGPNPTSGGGLYNAGTATLSKTTLRGNLVQQCCGGGIDNLGTLKLTNVTLASNQALFGHGGGLLNEGTATLNNVTIALNSADPNHGCSPACQGGGLNNAGTLYLTNSLIANNTGAGPDCAGTVISQGYNLIENTNKCTVTGSPLGNIYGQDPLLAPLQANGPTWTFYPRTGSPAIDAGNPAQPGSGGNACPLLDQRGTTRPLDGDFNGTRICDIGAVEHHQTT